jgi:hypothetical protein
MITAPSPFPDVEAWSPIGRQCGSWPPTSTRPRPSWRSRWPGWDDDGAWAGDGYLSIVHWLSVHVGMGRVSARELVLPRVAEAFASG